MRVSGRELNIERSSGHRLRQEALSDALCSSLRRIKKTRFIRSRGRWSSLVNSRAFCPHSTARSIALRCQAAMAPRSKSPTQVVEIAAGAASPLNPVAFVRKSDHRLILSATPDTPVPFGHGSLLSHSLPFQPSPRSPLSPYSKKVDFRVVAEPHGTVHARTTEPDSQNGSLSKRNVRQPPTSISIF